MTDEMDRAGYSRTASFDFLPVQSFQIFEPRSVLAETAPLAETVRTREVVGQ